VGDKILFHLIEFCQSRGHPVEGTGELANLLRRPNVQVALELALPDQAQLLRELFERSTDATRMEVGEKNGKADSPERQPTDYACSQG